ncbi:MAG TPA: class I SAM-dependent methyltransferase [Gemmatimonadaceae bacterium]|nr:class I SAM-dependent methyltransferase [Gemmatimonadaceae bacterium]
MTTTLSRAGDEGQPPRGRASYGLDAPGVVWGLLGGGAAAGACGLLLHFWPVLTRFEWAPSLGITLLNAGAWCLLGGVLMVASSYYGKFRARDRLLARLQLQGTESLLDVGCGHGLLLLGAAKLLPNGHATGLDLWSRVDQSDNSRAATLRNATLEGVADRVDVRDGDMRNMHFADATFDVVVANLAIHNVPTRDGRRQAIREIVRVLKPGGQVALMDLKNTGLYADELRRAGMRDVRVSWPSFWIWPPVRTATGRKQVGNG